jgi:hypothetical protein
MRLPGTAHMSRPWRTHTSHQPGGQGMTQLPPGQRKVDGFPRFGVAQHSGFGDASRLRKHFTAQIRLTPTAYRRTFGHPALAPPAAGPAAQPSAPAR